MICCSFIFRPGEYDEEFHRLDAQIEAHARGLPGFVKVENWVSADGLTLNAMYFFQDMASVRSLAQYPQHREAKQQVRRWYDAHRVVISDITAEYGDEF